MLFENRSKANQRPALHPLCASGEQARNGSQAVLDDGSVLQIGYAGTNGRPYVAIGGELVSQGALAKDEVSMQTIRAWLAAHPGEATKIMETNPSYVFFRVLKGDGPVGAEGTVLTAGRSLAVDPKFVAYGVPLWLETTDPPDPSPPPSPRSGGLNVALLRLLALLLALAAANLAVAGFYDVAALGPRALPPAPPWGRVGASSPPTPLPRSVISSPCALPG